MEAAEQNHRDAGDAFLQEAREVANAINAEDNGLHAHIRQRGPTRVEITVYPEVLPKHIAEWDYSKHFER